MESLTLPLTMEDILFYAIIAGCIGFAVIFIIVNRRSRQGFIDAAQALGYFSAPRVAYDIHGAKVWMRSGFNWGP